MSVRDPQSAAFRQLHDLRSLAGEIQRELETLQQEQQRLDDDIAGAKRHQSTSPRQRFVRGLGLGVVTVATVWLLALSMAHFAIAP